MSTSIGTPNSMETYTLYPTKKYNRPPPPSIIPLHGLDLLSPPIHIRNHRFYHRPQSQLTSTTPTEVIDKLKSSLAEALELYPAVAGIVRANEQGDAYIDTNAENSVGTPFLVEMKDAPYAGDTEDLSPRLVTVLPPGSSTLAVKVTQFSCGTIAVAASIHHQVTDLRGYLDFLEVWALLCRGEAIDFARIPEDWSHTPSRFFSSLTGRNQTLPTPPPPFTVLPAPATGAPACYMAPSDVSTWKFTKSNVERLKVDFSPSKQHPSDDDQWISSGDALSALLCGVVTRARENANVARLEGRSSLESQTESIAMAADGRHRSPQGNMLDGRYFGNFNLLPSATVSRSDLLSLTSESASRVALAIRNTLNHQLSTEAVAQKVSFFEDPQNTKPPGCITWTADIIMTNWCRFDLQSPKLDFGWGKPFCTTAGRGGIFPPGYMVLTQEKSSGDILVMVTVETEGVDKLKADPLLNKYAELVTVH